MARRVISTLCGEPLLTVSRIAEGVLVGSASFEYDAIGNRTKLVLPVGETRCYGYDELDRLGSVRADALGIDALTEFAYDAVGNRTALTDAKSHTTDFAYDALRRLSWERDALGKTEYYSYDPAGNLLSLTNWDGQATAYVHDELDRRTRVDFPEGYSAYYAYDAVGRLTGAHDLYEADTFVYDGLGRPTQRTIAGLGTMYFEYDLAGRRTMLKDPKGAAVYTTYDSRGLVTRVDSAAGSTYYAFDARGALLTRHMPNGTATYHTYDDAGRLSKLENRKSDGTALSTFEFTRDANGNIVRSLREDASCWYYGYDGLQRLTCAEWKDSGGGSLYAYQYFYDKVGNRTSLIANGQSSCCYTYNEANELTHELDGTDEIDYTYDGRGNQVTRTVQGGYTTYFAYNSRNLITAIWSDDPAFTPNYFAYNALGQRIQKVDSTGTTNYVWDGLNILLELDESNAVRRRYTYGYAVIEGVAGLIDVDDTASHYFYHFDQVGGVRQLTDPYQNTAQALEYEPFGRVLAESGSAPNDFRFPATYVSLPDQRASMLSPLRPYDVRSARFLSRDSTTGIASYSLPGVSPCMCVDPGGSDPKGLTDRQKQHVQNAVDYLKQSPNPDDKMAGAAAQKRLDQGDIKHDPKLDSGGETVGKQTRLATDKVDPDYGLADKLKKPLDPTGNPDHRGATISTAGSLVHEETHHEQSPARRAASNLNGMLGGVNDIEVEAYQAQLNFLQSALAREKDPVVRRRITEDINNCIEKLRTFGRLGSQLPCPPVIKVSSDTGAAHEAMLPPDFD